MKRLIISVLAILPIMHIFNSTNAAEEKIYRPVETIEFNIEEEKRKALLKEIEKYVEDEVPLVVNGIIVVNKDYNLPKSYTPDFEEEMEAMEAYEDMRRAAKEDGITINIRSGYRSYKEQNNLYNYYVRRDGEQEASRYSAEPGHSEHQLGTAFDFTTSNTNKSISTWFDDTPQAQWLYENAYKYGFVLRYPKEKEHITGYMHESWHYRYIGTEHSYNFKMNDLTIEEYLELDDI